MTYTPYTFDDRLYTPRLMSIFVCFFAENSSKFKENFRDVLGKFRVNLKGIFIKFTGYKRDENFRNFNTISASHSLLN